MRKTYQLNVEGKNCDRALDAVANEGGAAFYPELAAKNGYREAKAAA